MILFMSVGDRRGLALQVEVMVGQCTFPREVRASEEACRVVTT